MRGEVQASMKNRLYKVEICLKDDTIESCACTCPRGCDICHHMVALAFYGHYNVSITDKACSWLKKKGKEASVTAETCFASSSKSASRVNEVDFLHHFLKHLLVHITWAGLNKYSGEKQMKGPQ
ncbi:hypothetical protein RN001_006230 [Aquatica leii]|uniref:SWIM-type domain-containing protein n=1 Tax=Aquatica leii TaxID=1421715 RepID=A0AAN7PIA0_9COLE|nr:hypothetical protein RN001_006230 [Aquatica leii]